MSRQWTNWFVHTALKTLETSRARWLIRLSVFLIILLPTILVASFSYVRFHKELTTLTLERRQAVAQLASTVIKEKFDHLVDLGIALATRVQFRNLIAQGQWTQAMEILREVPKDFTFIDRVFLADLNGNLMADFPSSPDLYGKNFAYRDWYRGLTRTWQPYVSEVYQRLALPARNVVSIALPIQGADNIPLGILCLQIRIERFLEWSKGLQLESGEALIVDQKGHLVSYPRMDLEGERVDFSQVPIVQKILLKERGIQLTSIPGYHEQVLAAFEPVSNYGWGAVIAQPQREAFALRNKTLDFIIWIYGLIFFLGFALASVIIFVLEAVAYQHHLLVESEKRFRLLSDSAPVMIWMTDSVGNGIFFNKIWLEFTGRFIFQEEKEGWLENFHPDDLEMVKNTIKSSLIQKHSFHVECRVHRADGEYRWVRLSGIPRFSIEGKFEGFIGSGLDITQRRWGEERLEHAVATLTQSNEELKLFLKILERDQNDLKELKQIIHEFFSKNNP